MAEQKRYRLKAEVHAEYVGALEAIMCSFRNGHYYKITGMASLIVEALSVAEAKKQGGVSLESTVAALNRRYLEADMDAVRAAVEGFFERLTSLELAEVFVSEDPPVDIDVRRLENVTTSPIVAVIEENKELADILTLDPIHDVGPGGWPDRQ